MDKVKVNKSMEAYLNMFHELENEIVDNIEKYRKGDFTLILKGSDGTIIKNADISIQQVNHEFIFGCNGVMLGQLGKNNVVYEEKFVQLFNLVTTTFCWSITEVKPGKFRFDENSEEIFRRPPADRVLHFAQKYGLKIKGQPLLADSWYPEWASKDKEELKKQYLSYFKEVAKRYRKDFYMFDVVNEAFLCKERTPDFPLYDDQLSYVPWALNAASEIFSKDCLLERNEATFVNYGTKAEEYYREASSLLESGVRLDSLGIQFHMFKGEEAVKHLNGEYLNLREIYESYHRLSKLGIPLYISEITVPSKIEGFSKEEGEDIQRQVLNCLYRLWFSIPSMKGIIYWNLKDGKAWYDEGDCLGCLLDENLKEKPSYQLLYQLINREFRTMLAVHTDREGMVSSRGYYGDYQVTAVYEGKELHGCFSLSSDNSKNKYEVILK